jgi:hypothetical protein
MTRLNFNIGPYGIFFLKSSPLKPVSQFKANMAWMVLRWLTFKIMSCDPDLHPRWPPSADIVLTLDPKGNMFKNLLLWNQLANLKQTWHGWSLSGQFSKLCPVTLTSIQNGRLQRTYCSFNIGPYGISQFKANMAWMVLG